MPGITGAVASGAEALLARLEGALYPAARLRRQCSTATGAGFACAVASRLGGSGIAERDGACLAFEGWLAEPDLPERDLPAHLLDRFLEPGSAPSAIVEALRGAFQIVVRKGGETCLLADPVASRRLFYVHDGETLAFAPEVAPLTHLPGAGELDLANLVHFLASGRFFAGETLLSGVRQLLPGEVVRHRGSDLDRSLTFRYEVAPRGPDERDLPTLIAELAVVVERAVFRAFGRAKDPVFLLSGGYDSRYIFHTVARAVADPGRLRTALFGQRMDLPGADNATARAVARRFGVEHLSLPWRGELLPAQLGEIFAAQSGMTELLFTHSDELEVFRCLAEEHGFGSVLRGDECFGPRGGEVASADEALARISLHRACRVADLDRWFGGGELARRGAEAHAERLERLLAGAPAGPNELRDTLYGRERLPALLAHHNYHKSHFIEMVNPLLDVDVLRFWSTLPAAWRSDKRLFKECYRRRYADAADPPIATLDNGVDWPATLRAEPALAAWVRERLKALPDLLDRRFFLERLDRVLDGGEEPAPPPGTVRLPPVKLVARAVVLGEWWRAGWVR